MMMDTFVGIMTLGCFICLVICFGVQTFLKYYEGVCKKRWMDRVIDFAFIQAAERESERAFDRANEIAQSARVYVQRFEAQWQDEIDKQP